MKDTDFTCRNRIILDFIRLYMLLHRTDCNIVIGNQEHILIKYKPWSPNRK